MLKLDCSFRRLKRRSKTKNFLSISFSASRRRGGGRRREKNARKFFGFCTRESASVSEAHWFASPRNRSVQDSFKPPRAPRVRSGFAQRLIHHRNEFTRMDGNHPSESSLRERGGIRKPEHRVPTRSEAREGAARRGRECLVFEERSSGEHLATRDRIPPPPQVEARWRYCGREHGACAPCVGRSPGSEEGAIL